MASLQELERALVNADKAGDTEAARTLAQAVMQARQGAAPAPAPSLASQAGAVGRDVLAGAVRGAGSIGATLLAPVDAAARALGIQNDFIGRTDRRRAMTDALGTMGADTDSMAFKGGKLGAEVAGTLGVGGAISKGLLSVAPSTPSGLLQAISTAGMRTGATPATLAGRAVDIGTRTLGGAVVGGASAGLVNPEDAGTGAAIGAALPGTLAIAGKAGDALGRAMRGPEQPPELAAAVKTARDAGYVIPPTQARPTLGNRILEGISGKITTAQNASAQNAGVTNRLAAESLGLPGDTKITPDVLKTVRDSAGQAYEALKQTGAVTPGAAYEKALDSIAAPFVTASKGFPNAKPSPVLDLVDSLRSPQFDASAAVEKLKQLRTAADDAFRRGDTDIARASKSAAKALEDTLEQHLQSIGQPQLLQELRDARKLIAKTYTVEKALNPASGTVDARKLAAQVAKGKPVSDELRVAADFAATFPKASQTVEGMGSLPQTSPLDWSLGALTSAGTASPLGLLTVGARPAARALTLSDAVQNRLLQPPKGAPRLSLLQLEQLGYRAAPVVNADR